MNRLDWRGIAVFLGFTLVVGYALEAVFLYTGLIGAGKMGLFGQAALMVLLFLPGLGAVIARQVGPVAPENEKPSSRPSKPSMAPWIVASWGGASFGFDLRPT